MFSTIFFLALGGGRGVAPAALQLEGAALRAFGAKRCFSPAVRSPPFAPFVRVQKWSKGKVKEKLQNQVLFDKVTYERCINDVPKQKLITPSIISEKLKVNGSLARKAVKELISKNLIRPIMTHSSQTIYTRATNT